MIVVKNSAYGGSRGMILAALFAALTAVLAQIQIPLPFTPVPVSGQSFGPMLAGLVLGPRLGFASQLVYLALGLVGAPVFSGGASGPAQFVGPTGGYLIGFVLGAAVTGGVARIKLWVPAVRFGAAAALGGVVTVYLVGVPWLAASLGLPMGEAVAVGVLPFLLGDLFKVAAASLLGRRLMRALGPWQSVPPAGPG